MTRWYAHVSFCVTGLITTALFLSGCVAPSPQVIAPTPQVIMQGDTPGREEVQPIELDNCNGKGDAKRIEQRARSIESTISAEIAARFGASAEVLSAEVQAAVGAAMKWGTERSTSIELVAPPGTRMAFQLVWIGDEQVGIVQNLRASNIPIAFRSFKPTDVRIKSQYDIGCPPTPSAQRPAATPKIRSVAPVPSPTVQPGTPLPQSASDAVSVLKNGDIVALKCLGDIEGSRWLDGRTRDGTVGLAQQLGGIYTGTIWQVTEVGNSIVALKCLGDVEGYRWLDGRTRDGTVGLAPQVGGGYTGTKWQVFTTNNDTVILKCLGDIDGPRWLDGRTRDGIVGLAPDTSGYSGTRWEVVHLESR